MRLAITSQWNVVRFNGSPRKFWASFAVLLFAAIIPARAEEAFPFKAFVANDRTQLRSGPGDDHYSTDELAQGAEVEVYRRAEGGWLAIRPPQSSFSWLAQRDVKGTAQLDVGEVVGTAAVSWIGSNVDDGVDHRWLLKLDRGETVRILGKERRRMLAEGKTDVFYKISPPSGEFRWLHEDDVVREKSDTATISDPDVTLADFRVALKGTPRPEPASNATKVSTSTESKKDGFFSRDRKGSHRESIGEVALIPKRESASSSTTTATKSDLTLNSDLESRLRDLEVQLALVASQPANSWNFASLRSSAEQLAASGSSTLDRARVQLYLDKLAEFEDLKARHALMDPNTVPERPAARRSFTSDNSGVDPRFDGTGWLLPVHSSKKAAPPYALLDKDGNVLQFVSPAPGLNLNRYLRKEIGVFGQKDQGTTLDKPHLTAHRIVELDRHRK